MAVQRESKLIFKAIVGDYRLTDEAEIFLNYILERAFVTVNKSRSQFRTLSGERWTTSVKRIPVGVNSVSRHKVAAFEKTSNEFLDGLKKFATTIHGTNTIDSVIIRDFLKFICPRWPFC
ncbi:hypothetical protein [Flavobacterium nackdongense]|jgi:hypothetical protein|uniref:Uncharacterized protein n=1 Tax=Flavobacterium nackdongense TaxID=2547394 RepID=A0A4P6YAN8_9FLAO|nr:hypothetical protein [Flavobacterium nackdongense]QBN17263.1 hypothetical protein E1750_00060 [Flavobacterium nackdongense]